MPKNGVNTCPPISEYELINAPKFSLDNDDLFYNYFLLIKNYYQIQTTSILSILPTTRVESYRKTFIGNFFVRIDYRWPIKVSCTVKCLQNHDYLPFTSTIPWLSCEQLPYPSKQPRILRIWQREKSKIPLLISTYKYFLPQHSSSTLPFSISILVLSGGDFDENNSRIPAAKKLSCNKAFPEPSSLWFFLFLGRKWLSTSSCLRLIHPHPLFPLLQFFTFLRVYILSIFFLFFLSFWSPNSRIWVTGLLFPLSNPTSNAWVQDPDTTDLISAETNKIRFRAENFSLDLWKDTFRSWPKPTKGWKDWFVRASGTNEVYWGNVN